MEPKVTVAGIRGLVFPGIGARGILWRKAQDLRGSKGWVKPKAADVKRRCLAFRGLGVQGLGVLG